MWKNTLKRTLKVLVAAIVAVIIILIAFFFAGRTPPAVDVRWGVTFVPSYAENLGLKWQATYRALLDDLGVRHLRLAAPWDETEPARGSFDFSKLDLEMSEAAARGADVLLAVGMRTPRWPECHIPAWAGSLTKDEQQKEILAYLTAVVSRYKDSAALTRWQAENEPLINFTFGTCPWQDEGFLKKEIALMHELDPHHPVVVSDTGEFSLWWKVARLGDVVGTTLYRTVFSDPFGRYLTYPVNPVFYARKAWLVGKLFGKEVINTELQAEPWTRTSLASAADEEMNKTMSIDRFRSTIDFAERTGIKEFYLWGAEWWYFMKETRQNSAFWDEAKKLFPSAGASAAAEHSKINVSYLCNKQRAIDATFDRGVPPPAVVPGEPPIPTGSVSLVLSDGRRFTLPQTISADGARYANGDESFIFWSKGDGALVLENGVEKSYTGCVVPASVPR